jgi:hypothetical protein
MNKANSNLSNSATTILLVVFTPTYTPFGRSFANKNTTPCGWCFLFDKEDKTMVKSIINMFGCKGVLV